MVKIGDKVKYTGTFSPELIGKTFTVTNIHISSLDSKLLYELDNNFDVFASNCTPLNEPKESHLPEWF